MKKRLVLILSVLLFAFTLFSACGGGNGETYSNITAQRNPYSMGTQDIEIVASSSAVINDEPTAKFKKSISADDIELGQALTGKKVTKVVYNSESSIVVTLDGNTKASGGKGVYGTITVKQSGMESKGNSTCTVEVRAPQIVVNSFSGGGKTGTVVYKLVPVGEFTDKATNETVTLADGATGDVTVVLENGMLKVTVKNCSVDSPFIVIAPEATTFNKEIKVRFSALGSADL